MSDAPKTLAPPGPVAGAFIEDLRPLRLLLGPMRSGKKTAAILAMLGLAFRYPGQKSWRWLIVSSSIDYIEAHVVPAVRHVIGEVGRWSERPVPNLTLPLNEPSGRAFAQLELVFFGLDRSEHRARWANWATTGICLVDARRLPESVFDDGLVTIGTYPDDGQVRGVMLVVSGMPAAGHWLLTRRELALFRQPGGRSPEGARTPARPHARPPSRNLGGGTLEQVVDRRREGGHGFGGDRC